ncbi:restriction endonuclease subunit S [Candidatus Kirkpatrickella diaphorinae]|uniref:Restriction endonuclease subunit S n=1 Tax=Candidatus Kirkpatrickella diaphorinae TaxID=2984322 RepID=A0ABY6GJ04_9PROT|nr:restriction endonuclease subunit S [Candidatus Kirkpatrickella diaphorinae]UYH51239.1 restriction endonuclease subunit S [Candidatus Kirkpatrickella diaphorinae]
MSSKGKLPAATRGESALVPKLRFPEFKEAEEWALLPMGEIYSFGSNNSLSREKLNYSSGSIKNVHYGDIHTKFSSHFYITKEIVPYVNEAELGSLREGSFCREGDLILADASEDLADIGKCMEITYLNNEKVVAGLHTILAHPTKKQVAVGFGGHLFQSVSVRRQVQREAQGAKVLGISPRRLQDIRLPLPSHPEQQKIADCLASTDALIEAQGRKVEALKAHKKGLLQQLFPQEGETQPRLRFPEFREAGEWKLDNFADLIFFQEGPGIMAVEFHDEGVPLVRLSGLIERSVSLKGCNHLDPEKVAKKWSHFRLEVGDILVSCSASLGRPAIVDEVAAGAVFYTGLIRFKPKNTRLDVSYLEVFLGSPFFQRQAESAAVGGGIKHFGPSHLRQMKAPRPPNISEQKRIADCLTSIDGLIAVEARKLNTLKTHKKGLLQQLFPRVGEVNA